MPLPRCLRASDGPCSAARSEHRKHRRSHTLSRSWERVPGGEGLSPASDRDPKGGDPRPVSRVPAGLRESGDWSRCNNYTKSACADCRAAVSPNWQSSAQCPDPAAGEGACLPPGECLRCADSPRKRS
jgi:hypothetical protein